MTLTELPAEPPPPPFRKRKRPRAVPVLAFLLGGFCLLLSGVPFLFLLFWVLAIPAIFMGYVALAERYPMRALGVIGAILGMLSLGAGLSATINAVNNTPSPAASSNVALAPAAGPQVIQASTAPTAPAPVITAAPVSEAPAPVVPPVSQPSEPVAPVVPDGTATGDGSYTSQDTSGSSVYYQNCDAVRAAGKDPLYRGDPGYASKLDRDGDGVACE